MHLAQGPGHATSEVGTRCDDVVQAVDQTIRYRTDREEHSAPGRLVYALGGDQVPTASGSHRAREAECTAL